MGRYGCLKLGGFELFMSLLKELKGLAIILNDTMAVDDCRYNIEKTVSTVPRQSQ